MKKNMLFTLIILLFGMAIKAQINLVGVANNYPSNIGIVKWQALNPESVTTFPSILNAYYFASSAFDSYNSKYYITGISGNNTGLYSFNTVTNQEHLSSGASLYSNISEFDMSTGMMYTLKLETADYISVYAYDISADQDSLIGLIHEPGINGIVVDAIGFDANNGILYYVGFTNDPALCLYAIPVRDNQFSFTRTILNTTAPNNNFTSVNFDNVNEILYARNATFDTNFIYTGSFVVEINTTSGDVISRGELVEFPYFVGGSSSFDQNTGTFLLVGIDTSNMTKMIAFNTYDNTYVTGFVPGNASEIVCDNTVFAQNKYVLTRIKPEQTFNFRIYPNPVSEILTIESPSAGKVTVQLISSYGKRVIDKDFSSGKKIELNLSSLAPGVYTVNLTSEGKTASEKLLVK
ncbi:MAG: T9SS type A sorting domain-containing protein [Bacteroidales bacterium]|nr:T9SS type A sorting domain-containing protein [Bacteroidales bacterium]